MWCGLLSKMTKYFNIYWHLLYFSFMNRRNHFKRPLKFFAMWWSLKVIIKPTWLPEARLILGLCPANERRRYFVTTSLTGWRKLRIGSIWPIESQLCRKCHEKYHHGYDFILIWGALLGCPGSILGWLPNWPLLCAFFTKAHISTHRVGGFSLKIDLKFHDPLRSHVSWV